VLIAPCGWGKTLAFFLPMVYWPGSTIAIVSPLIALMNDQQQVVHNEVFPYYMHPETTALFLTAFYLCTLPPNRTEAG